MCCRSVHKDFMQVFLWRNGNQLHPRVQTQMLISACSPPSPVRWHSHSNAAVCRWCSRETLSRNCVTPSSCGELADGSLPTSLQLTRITNRARGRRGGAPLKCKITTAVVVRRLAPSLSPPRRQPYDSVCLMACKCGVCLTGSLRTSKKKKEMLDSMKGCGEDW